MQCHLNETLGKGISELCKAHRGAKMLGEMEWKFEREEKHFFHSCYMVVINYLLKECQKFSGQTYPVI